MRPGSLAWLLRNELRLQWRSLTVRYRPAPLLIALAVLVVGLHAALWLLFGVHRTVQMPRTLPDPFVYLAALVTAFVGSLLLAQAIAQGVRVLFERGDLDLLLASPVSSRAVFAARALGLMASGLLTAGLFALPAAALGLALGLPQLLGVYGWLLALTLSCSGLGLLLTLLLVRLLGVRRTRVAAQVGGSLIGAAFFLVGQLFGQGGQETSRDAAARLEALVLTLEASPLLGPQSVLWYGARAVWAEPLPTVLSLAFSAAVFAFAVRVTHRAYLTGVQQAAEAAVTRAPRAGRERFRGGLGWTTLLKEWRLIRRDPLLISQTLLQLLYLLPLLFVLTRGGAQAGRSALGWEGGLGVAVVLLGSSLAASLARICVSAEEAPDLLAGSPAGSARLKGYKLLAALIPTWLLLLPLVVLLALRGLPGWPAALLAGAGVTLTAAVLHLWNARPVPRGDLFRGRQRAGDLLMNLLVFVSVVAWTAVALGLPAGSAWGWGGLGLGLLIPGLAYLRGRRLERQLGY
ncbi:ABC-2 type transport system permease protein [Deinobacterium chartae]|uniref:ABC-2 type transport system permease protein n=1 Tax=Deinobacterium chartae TaxID=521158 RepID=A0A841I154_9DEIO|nr:hypothetical protein [Deinobacterium chartae]MBB6098160.1 ABC-2 type transport system permease protein [Deinobacterium chartae]